MSHATQIGDTAIALWGYTQGDDPQQPPGTGVDGRFVLVWRTPDQPEAMLRPLLLVPSVVQHSLLVLFHSAFKASCSQTLCGSVGSENVKFAQIVSSL